MQDLTIFFKYSYTEEILDIFFSEMKQQGIHIKVVTIQQDLLEQEQDGVILTDDASLASECTQRQIPYLFLLNDFNNHESLPSGTYCVESVSDVSYDYLDKVYRRAKGLPWNILSTERLRIREITVEDVPRLYELYEDESITRYMEPLFPEQQQEEDYTRDYIKNVYHFYGYGMWLITLKENNTVIGRAGLEYKEGFEGLELGFMLGTEYQHKGYAYEACKAILEYAREELEQVSFRAIVHKNNEPSKQLCKKLGMIELCRVLSKEEEEYLEYCINGVL